MRQNPGFTLVEVLVAVTLTGVILLTGYSAFQRIMQSQLRLGAVIDVQKNLFYTNEKLAALIRDGGTVDYEEYFNRRMLGYTQTTTNGIYTFTNFSHFGNGNIASKSPIYYCGVSTSVTAEACMDPATDVLFNSSLYPPSPGNSITANYHFSLTPPAHQAYGQYAALAYNYLDPVGFPMPIKLPPIFKTGGDPVKVFNRTVGTITDTDPVEVGLPELYLIKKNLDNTYERTYFRHVYVKDPFPGTPACDPTNNGANPASNINGCLGKIQITKLTSCDNLLASGALGSDGIIDAWIPTQEFWTGVGTWSCDNLVPDTASIYKAAHEETMAGPINPNLTWVDLTSPDMNVIRATFLPHPLKIPSLMSGAGDKAEATRVSVYLEVILSTRLRNRSFVRPEKNDPRTLITTYDLSE